MTEKSRTFVIMTIFWIVFAAKNLIFLGRNRFSLLLYINYLYFGERKCPINDVFKMEFIHPAVLF